MDNVTKVTMTAEQLVSTYKTLSQVELAFRRLKSIDLKVVIQFSEIRRKVQTVGMPVQKSHAPIALITRPRQW